MLKKIQAFFNPEQFQGWGKKKSYFEGWYYKIVDPTEKYAFAIIPGITLNKTGERHAFIQVLDGKKLSASYHKFNFDAFRPSPGKFEISIANNHFSENEMELILPEIKGKLVFQNNVPWPKPIHSPGIMGPYSFVPFMECYHGIISMDHSITGQIEYDNHKINFDNGRGYIEKDWGKSFPSAYFWLQSNHFSKPGLSIKASVAKIPWLNSHFTGFICGVWIKDRLIRFTSYNGTVLQRSFANEAIVEIIMRNKNHEISIIAHRDNATGLASPILGQMEGRIEESMNARIKVVLTDLKKNKIILEDTARNGGLEVAGNIHEIFV